MIGKPFWVVAQTEMTDFPTLLYTSTSRVAKEQENLRYSKIPTLSYTCGLKKILLPVKAIIGSTPRKIHKHSTRGANLVCQTYEEFHERNPYICGQTRKCLLDTNEECLDLFVNNLLSSVLLKFHKLK